MNDYIRTDHISTDRLIAELERREREEPGAWTPRQQRQVMELAKKLNPLPIDSTQEQRLAWHVLERAGVL